MKKEVAIVIPIYKEELLELESISLLQMTKVFVDYDKFFVMPFSLKKYPLVKEIERIWFDNKWFKNSSCYSKLLMNTQFYEIFIQYKYILIYQLDAFVFEDKLKYFCDLDYDYIGAPWLCGLKIYHNYQYNILHVGNGGFSLRNVVKCIELIKQKQKFFQQYINEDIFFSLGSSEKFRVAPIRIALEFSFEREVRKCFELNENKLPFGCHAWERYDLEFWKPYLEEYGYKIEKSYLLKGNEDFILEEEYEKKRNESFFWEHICTRGALEKLFSKKQRDIYIWGAGEKGHFVGKLFSNTNVKIKGFLDNDKKWIGTYIESYQVLSTENLSKNIACAYIIIAMDKYKNDVAKQLEEMGCRYNKDYIFYIDLFRLLKDNYNLTCHSI